MSQNFHNQIASLSINHFNNLPKKGKPNFNEWTVLSCIIKENVRLNHFEVVALGTGSKCIGKAKMSPKGDILNDSHAEVICRRAFLRYIYDDLNSKNFDLFNFDSTNKCSLNEHCRFHFFTSHVPCGDAAIFSKQNPNEFGEIVAVPLKRCIEDDSISAKRSKGDWNDVYRTGAKCLPQGEVQDLRGSGVKYHTFGAVRTKPGRGDPTLSVSCSDKLARWCQVGLQGALLARILKDPIYLSSFTIAADTPFNKESLQRALFERLNKSQSEMPLGQASVSFSFCKNESNAPSPTSIVWFKSKISSLEVSVNGFKQGVTKKDRGTKAARLRISKIEMFRIYLKTVNTLFGDAMCDVFYDETKTKAVEYQRAWSVLKKEGFKCWTIKDKNLQHFTID